MFSEGCECTTAVLQLSCPPPGPVLDQQQDLQDPPQSLEEHGSPEAALPVLQPADRDPRQPAPQHPGATFPWKPHQQHPEGRLQRTEEPARPR